MAKKSKIAKTERQNAAVAIVKTKSDVTTVGGKPVLIARQKNRCNLCGRPRGYMRRFGICRVCFRGMAHRGLIPGVTKSSW